MMKPKILLWTGVALFIAMTITACVSTNSAAIRTGDRIYRVNGVSFIMKPIAAVRGAVLGDIEMETNKEHTVNLSAYYIGETEVTQELWQAVMGSNPSQYTNSIKNPVDSVNWWGCIIFCNQLTMQIMGEEHCVYSLLGETIIADLNKKGFRLPTEAEWEYAAMGGTKYRWAGTDSEADLKKYAWYYDPDDPSMQKTETSKVKTKLPNGYGLYDMSGNVGEWCTDLIDDIDTPVSGQTNPQGALSGEGRVIRGLDETVCAGRIFVVPDQVLDSLGLRIVCRP